MILLLGGLTRPWPWLVHARPGWVTQGELVLVMSGRDLTRLNLALALANMYWPKPGRAQDMDGTAGPWSRLGKC